MSIFRVEHTTGFTVMSNYHLRGENQPTNANRLSFRVTEPYSNECRRRRASPPRKTD